MFVLLRRDCLWSLLITLGFLSTVVFFFICSTGDVNAGLRIFYLIGVLVICLPGFSLLSNELKESYRFLQILPVSAAEIVISRFLLILAQVVLFWVVVMIILNGSDMTSFELSVGIGFVNLCAILSLLLAALWYWLIFRFGLSISTRIMSIAYFGIIVAVIYLAEIVEGDMSEWWGASFTPIEWIGVFILTLAICFLLMRLAIQAKTAGAPSQ